MRMATTGHLFEVRHTRSRPLDEVQIGNPCRRKMRQAGRFRRRDPGLQAFERA
jgi:hypothetical protein